MPNVSTDGGDPAQPPERGDGRLLAQRYRLLTVVGHGGMGTVWHAHDEVLGRDVAVKEVILPHGLTAEEREVHHKRTFREARTAARLAHPSVVTVFDVVEEDGRPWIIMELIKAHSLDQVIRDNGRLPPRRAAEIARQMLGALHTAHEAGVLHRDVKPSNVLVALGDRVVLTDFGIATAAGDVTLTQTGLVMGSPAYIAPERARGRTAGPASDLWALGITMYAMVEGGSSPYERSEPMASLVAVISEEPEPPEHAGPLRPIIEGLLRKDPDERMSALETGAMLDQVVRGLSMTRRNTLPMTQVPEPATTAFDTVRDDGPARPAAGEDDEAAGGADAPAAALPVPPAPAAPPAAPESPTAESPTAKPRTAKPRTAKPRTAKPRTAKPPVAESPAAESPVTSPAEAPGAPAGPAATPPVPNGSGTATTAAGRGADVRQAAAETAAPAADPTIADRPSLPGTEPGTRPAGSVRPSARGRTTLVIVGIAVAALLILGVWAWLSKDEEQPSNAAQPTPRPPSASPTQTTPSPTRTPSPGVPAGFRDYHDRTGFSIAVPKGWTGPQRRASDVFFYSPDGRSYVQIAQTDDPNPSALEDWRSQASGAAGRFSGYRLVKLGPTGDHPPVRDTDDGSKSADWEFTWGSGSGKKHVLDRGFVTSGHGYAILVSAPDDDWPATIDRLQPVFTSFRPAK
jgi:hypothetical protein